MKKVLLVSFLVIFTLSSVFAGGKKEESKNTPDTSAVTTVQTTPEDQTKVTTISTGSSVVATVELYGKTEITKSEVNEFIEAAKEKGITLTAEEAINNLILQVIYLQFVNNQATTYSEEELTQVVSNYLLNLASQYGVELKSEQDVADFLAKLGVSEDEFKNTIIVQYIEYDYITKNYAEQLNAVATPTAEQVETFYNENKDSDAFKAKTCVKVAHIFVPFSDTESDNNILFNQMKGIRENIVSGKTTFEQAAFDYSRDTSSSSNGGAIQNGWLEEGSQVGLAQLGQNGMDAVFALKTGEVSQVVEGVVGYHIFKALARREAKVLTLDDLMDLNSTVTVREYCTQVLSELLVENVYNSALDELLLSLKDKAQITVNAF